MEDKIRVLVVDDASFMRKAVSDILGSDDSIEVVGTAKNGLEGLDMVSSLSPDVITLDIDMPVMDGLTSIRHLMIKHPTPIVVLSSLFNDGTITFEALRLGVVDFVAKPSGAVSSDIEKAKSHLIARVKMASDVCLENIRRVRLKKWDEKESISDRYGFRTLDYLVTLGTSLSGPNTVIRLLANLDPKLPAAIVVTQEIEPKILPDFVRRFNEHVEWNVEEATNGALIEQGSCYIHSNHTTLSISVNEKNEPIISIREKSDKPLNTLFSSAAHVFGRNTVGILLTGLGSDGDDGFKKIREQSGITIAQNRKCCVFPNLTDNVVKQQLVDFVVDERRLPGILKIICKGSHKELAGYIA